MPRHKLTLGLIKEAGHQERLTVGKKSREQRVTNAERAAQTSANKTKTSSVDIEKSRQSEVFKQGTATSRSTLRKEEITHAANTRISTQEEIAGNRRQERATNAVLFGAANSSMGVSFGMIIALFFLLVIVYIVVTNGENFGTLLGSVGNFIRGLSSNTPLFVKNNHSDTSSGVGAIQPSATITPTS
jgi:cobalamin biosynthesis Mg chelatase CobN